MNCKFRKEYWDAESDKSIEFECSEPAVKDGFCIFHHPEYWEENEKQVRKQFYKKIKAARQNPKRLLCIGYNLPSIQVKGEFRGPVDFKGTKFHGKTSFSGVKFSRDASFVHAEFLEEADFSHAAFCGLADFFIAKFTKKTSFNLAKFSEKAFFTKLARTQKDVKGKIKPSEKTSSLARATSLRRKSENNPLLFFLDVKFLKPELVRFDGFNLENTSFQYTDISKINFGERVTWGCDRRIFDERLADAGEPSVIYDVVANVYRGLRQNFESRMRYAEAGRFFIGEMECKRKDVKMKNHMMKWIRTNIFSALAWYKHMSKYGESYSRVILWILVTPILAAILTVIAEAHMHQFIDSFLQSLQNYIMVFFQLRTSSFQELTLRLVGLLLMGQLYISLRRQFERRYRG